jgi:DNA-binding transcriptional regulator YdaS (Cro superfamily)
VLQLQATLLERAAQILGGSQELCEYLGVSEARLELWQAARVRLPDPIFLRAVDLVLRDDIERASHDRRQRRRDAIPGVRTTSESLSR